MQSAIQLQELLRSINRKSYPAYKSLKGVYQFQKYILAIDHVQGDPFASPSRLRFEVKKETHGFPEEYYEEKHKDIPFLTPPLVTNGALAVELALKFLIFKENGAFECIHNLKTLYEQLPEPHKTTLTNQIFTKAHQNSQTLDMNLSNISNLFEDYRYFFSKVSVGFSGFFNDFIHIICNYALSFKSEYNND